MVPTTCGAGSGKDHGSSGSRGEGKGAKREQRGVKSKSMIPSPCGAGSGKHQGIEGQQRERRGANREQREQKHFYTMF